MQSPPPNKAIKPKLRTKAEIDASVIEPSPDPAVVANPITQEEVEAEAEVAIARAEQARVHAELAAPKKKPWPAGRPKDQYVYVGEQQIEGITLIAPGTPGWEKLEVAQNALTAANAKLMRIQAARTARIRKWTFDHQDDPTPVYTPVDPRYGVIEGFPRPAIPSEPERVKLMEEISKAARKVRELSDRLATWPRNADLAGEVVEAGQKETEARAGLTDFDRRRIARHRAREIEAELATQRAATSRE